MKEYKPYCYLIGWSNFDTWYYGSEYANRSKIANPSNLWTIYFTSSTKVKEFIKLHGRPDIIKIRKIFETANDTISWEYRVLRKLKVRKNPKWLNINEGKAPVGVAWSDKQKKEQSMKVSGIGNPMYGKRHNRQTKKLISERSKKIGSENGMYGKTHTKESRNKIRDNNVYLSGELNRRYGAKHSVEVKDKMSESHKPTTFSYNHPTHGIVNSTMRRMIRLYPELKYSGLKHLSSGYLKTYKGWYLLDTISIP